MRSSKFLPLLFSVCLFDACQQEATSHFISDSAVRSKIESDFNSRKQLVANDSLFAIPAGLNLAEQEAFQFLYAYMPIGDITDYGSSYFVDQIRHTFAMKAKTPWGDSIPETIFRHFVLPVRSNNEALDHFRTRYGDSLLVRVKDLSLRDAALAVNHWCHEHVIYTSTDGRTFGPEASMRNAAGRCGEESVFTVAAMRAVGIPARQVYSPRWAHTDDNHAWVEVYVENKWQFLGACEPEPVLNLGWFNGPASRGLLMLTNVFGASYNGPEEVVTQNANNTTLNVMYTYGPTANATFLVKDTQGNPVEGANVEFKIFNYGEFNTVTRKTTDPSGQTFLNAGLGEMMVWASKGDQFGFAKVSFGKEDQVEIVLDKCATTAFEAEMDLVPPVESAQLPEVTPAMRTANNVLMATEDSIRNAYTATFLTEEQAKAIARKLNLDEVRVSKLLLTARGNHAEIERFLTTVSGADQENALALLETVTAKDLRDVPTSVFTAHLSESIGKQHPLYHQYILNPRIDREFLSAYKGALRAATPAQQQTAVQADPQVLVEWVKTNIRVDNTQNNQRIAMQPMGVWQARIADEGSRNRFFVAYARALGVPARLEPVTRKVQYYAAQQWHDVSFEGQRTETVAPQGELKLTYKPTKAVKNPDYYKHFTIARVNGNTLQTLGFESNANVDMGGGASLANLMKHPLMLDQGNYVLVTGSRQGDGSVLSKITSFEIIPGKKTQLELVLREDAEPLKVMGSLTGNETFAPLTACTALSLNSATNNSAYIVAILGAKQEPTNHVLRDIAALTPEFEQWGGKQIHLFPNREEYGRFDANEFKGLPATILYGLDSENKVIDALMTQGVLKNKTQLPIVAIVNKQGEIVFISQGYTIGLGAQMLKVIHKL